MPVDAKHLEECISEAERFLVRAIAALTDLKSSRIYADTRLTAATRRSSMDLARALSRLRAT